MNQALIMNFLNQFIFETLNNILFKFQGFTQCHQLINMNSKKIIVSLVFMAIIVMTLSQNRPTLFQGRIVDAVTAPNVPLGNYFGSTQQLFWVNHIFDPVNNQTKIKVQFFDDSKTENYTFDEETISGTVLPMFFTARCGFGMNTDTTQVIPYVVDPVAMIVTALPALGTVTSLGVKFGATQSELESYSNWDIHQSCKGARYKNIVTIYDVGTSTYKDFPSGFSISAVSQNLEYAVASGPSDSGQHYIYKLDWTNQAFLKIGTQTFKPVNVLKSYLNNLVLTSCGQIFQNLHPDCKNYVYKVEASSLVSLLDPQTTVTTQVSRPIIMNSALLDIVVFISAYNDRPASVVFYDTEFPLKKVKRISTSQQVRQYFNSLMNTAVNVKIQRDGFVVLNIYVFSTQKAYQLNLRIDQNKNEIVSFGINNLTLQAGYQPGLSKFHTLNGKKVMVSQTVKGVISSFSQFKVYVLELVENDRPVPTFSEGVVYSNATGLKQNIIMSRQQYLDWVVMFEDDTKTSIYASFYNQAEPDNLTTVGQQITGAWAIYATNNWDCFIVKDKTTANNYKLFSIDHTARTISQLTTNLVTVLTNLDTRLAATNTDRKIFVADQCKGFSIDSFVYYLNNAGDTFTEINMVSAQLQVQSFDKVMKFASLKDLTDNKYYLYRVNGGKTGFDKLQYSDTAGTIHNMLLHSYGSEIRSFTDSLKQTVIIACWSDYSTGNGQGKYIVAQIPAGKTFREMKHQLLSNLKTRPYLFSSNKHTISGFYAQTTTGKLIRGTNNLFEFSTSINLSFPPKAQLIATGLASSGIVGQKYILMNIANQMDVLYRVRGPQLIQVSSKNYNSDESYCYSRSIIKEDTPMGDFLFRQYVCPINFGAGFNFQLTKSPIVNSLVAIPNVPSMIQQQSLDGATYQGVGSPRHELRWMYVSYPDTTKTTINLIAYDHIAETVTIADHNLTGTYDVMASNQVGMDCGIFKKKGELTLQVVKLDLVANTFTNMPNINTVITALNIQKYPRIHVGKECNAIAIDNTIIRLNAAGNDWQLAVTTGITFGKFDQRIQYALGKPTATPSDPWKLYVYSKPSTTHIYTLVPNSDTYLPQVTQFESYDKTISAISIQKNSNGTFIGKAVVTVHNSTGANNILSQEATLVNIPRMITNKMLTIAMIIFQTDKLNTKIYTTTIDQSVQSLKQIPQHQRTKFLQGYQDVYIYIDQNYAVIHPIPPAGRASFQEIYLEFFQDKVYLLGTKFINPILAPYWQSTIFKQVNGDMVIYSDYYFPKDKFKQNFWLIITKDRIGSITVPVNPKDSKFAKMGSGFFDGIGGRETECIPNCAACSDHSTCDKCASGFVKKSDNTCGKCTNNCKTCAEGALATCLSCFEGFYQSGSTCLPCSGQCLQCSTTATSCTVCKPGKTVAISGTGCTNCSNNCVSCSFDSTNTQQCLQCRPGTALHNGKCRECLASCSVCDGASIGICYSCDIGYLFVSGSCLQCGKNCQRCTSSSNCVQCQDGYQNVGGICYPNCQFPCTDCVNGSPQQCVSACWAGYVFNTSAKSCDPDTSCNTGSTCTVCPAQYALAATAGPSSCQPCTAGVNCRRCKNGFLSTCQQCKFGFYLDDANHCQNCPVSCTSCQNQEVCVTCLSTHFEKKGQCIACQSPCITCQGAADKCKSCNETAEYFLVGWKCLYNQYVNFTIRINIDLATYYDNYEQIRAALAVFVNGAGDRIVTFFDIRTGSSINQGQMSNPNNDPNLASNMMAALTSGSTIAGFQILESSFSSSAPSTAQEGANLGLILGLAIPIPLLIIAGIIIGVVIYKKKAAAAASAMTVHVADGLGNSGFDKFNEIPSGEISYQ